MTVIYNPTVSKLQSEINRAEFIRWYWIAVTTYENPEPVYIRGRERPISEAVEAAAQFDEWLQAYRVTEQIEKDKNSV